MKYTITIDELIRRPIIRDDQAEEYLNKMTDAEIKKFEKEMQLFLELENVGKKFPDINVSIFSKIIDRSIIYKIFKLEYDQLIIELNKLEKEYETDSSMSLRSEIDSLKEKINPNYFISSHKDYLKL